MHTEIHLFINEDYNSNTYLIKNKDIENLCYLIDAGQSEKVLNALEENDEIRAIFLTHAHYDHICGINRITARFPNCTVYCAQYTKEALADSKMNLSFYHKLPTTYVSNNTIVVKDQDTIEIYPNSSIKIWETAGHNEGCISYKIGKVIFTGDTLIPGVKVVTKLKSGNKLQALQSIQKIKSNSNPNDTIFPGHGSCILTSDVDWHFYLK